MPFDTFTLRVLFYFSLMKVLVGLPAESQFEPWHDGTSRGTGHGSYGQDPPRRSGAGLGVQVVASFARRNVTRSRGESAPGFAPQESWYRLEPRERAAQDFPEQLFRRSSSAPAEDYLGSESYGSEGHGVENFGNTYSSHVNCQLPNRNEGELEKAPKRIGENVEPIFGSVASENVEKINFDEASRGVRTGTSREGEPLRSRIITPKGGSRRPPQGTSGKNQSKPFNQGATNTIPTTEKTFRNQTQKGSSRPRPGAAKPQGGDIVFPDGYRRQKFTPRVSKCGKRATFCELLGEEYPSDYIGQVLKKEGAMFREFFGKDVIADPNITERINAPEENSLCPYRQEVVFPRAAQNKEDKWLFIVNQDQYVQGVTVEVCLNPESRCILTEGFPLGYTPYCKQKYIERRLVAIGEDGKPHSDSFRLPSCCSCVVKHETSARMALGRFARGTPHLRHSPPSSSS